MKPINNFRINKCKTKYNQLKKPLILLNQILYLESQLNLTQLNIINKNNQHQISHCQHFIHTQQLMNDDNQLENSHLFIKNRYRLIQQNTKLYKEIFNLQQHVSSLLAKKFQNDFEETQSEEKLLAKHKLQTKEQVSQIKRLKQKIIRLKAQQRQFQGEDLRKALDELTFAKNQRIKYQTQRQDLYNKKSRKKEALQLDKPIGKQKSNVDSQYKKVKLLNGQYINKITEIQREIRKYHKIKQLAKTSQPKIVENSQFQIRNIENQIHRVQEQIKNIQKQWKPRVDSLSSEYCEMKDIVERKKKQIEQLQKIQATCKTRISVMKQQTAILNDRQRISQVIISPKKRMEINKKLQQERKRHTMSNPKPILFSKDLKTNPQLIKKPKENTMKKILQSVQKKIEKQKQQSKSQKKWDNHNVDPKLQVTVFSENNQFFMSKQIQVDHQTNKKSEQLKSSQKKQNKILQSVGVGTSFYFNEQDQ